MAESLTSIAQRVNGKTFGLLTAVGPAYCGRNTVSGSARRWVFTCICGGEFVSQLVPVMRRTVRDCGCVAREEHLRRLEATGDYITETVLVRNEFGQELTEITRNRAVSVFDKWVGEDEDVFERRHLRVIGHARDLWRDMATESVDWDHEHDGKGTAGTIIRFDNAIAARAANLLRRAKSLVEPWEWEIFENVIRWNEPHGLIGSRLCNKSAEREARAKNIVRDVAEVISRALFL